MMGQQVVLLERYHDQVVSLMHVLLALLLVELLQLERVIAVAQCAQKQVLHVLDQTHVQQHCLHVMEQVVLLQ